MKNHLIGKLDEQRTAVSKQKKETVVERTGQRAVGLLIRTGCRAGVRLASIPSGGTRSGSASRVVGQSPTLSLVKVGS